MPAALAVVDFLAASRIVTTVKNTAFMRRTIPNIPFGNYHLAAAIAPAPHSTDAAWLFQHPYSSFHAHAVNSRLTQITEYRIGGAGEI